MKISTKWTFIIVVVILLGIIIYQKQFNAHTPAINQRGPVSNNSTAVLQEVELGNMKQCILSRGNDISNPVLLWLHGGPGSSQMPIARYYNGDLEKEFIVVHWDQRGAGKSNTPDFNEETMTIEQFINDAHELTQYLKNKYNKEKIYLLGHSWGTQFGIKLVEQYPEDYYAYIGVSQVTDSFKAQEIAYNWLSNNLCSKEIVKNKDNKGSSSNNTNNDKKSNKKLESLKDLGAPPYTNHHTYVKFAKMVSSHGGGMDINMGKLALISLRSPEYKLTDYIRWLNGANRGSGPMWDYTKEFYLLEELSEIQIPVYFFSGRNDYNTPLALVEDCCDRLTAPMGKSLIIFENSAHAPFMAEPEKFNNEVVKVKNETYK